MIIFGWGRQTIRRIGIVFKNLCGNCHNEEYWVLTRIMTWFTLFFIPVFPYEAKYNLSCPVCQYGITLKGEQVKQFKPVAEANELLITGKITETEYHSRLSAASGQSGNTAVQDTSATQLPAASTSSKKKFCKECGRAVLGGVSFCASCGTAITS